MNRLFLYSGLFFILILIFDAYDRDYNQSANNVNQTTDVEQSSNQTKTLPPEGDIKSPLKLKPKTTALVISNLENDKLVIKIDSSNGEVVYAELKEYSTKLGSKEKVVLLDYVNKAYTAGSNIQALDINTKPVFNVLNRSADSLTLISQNVKNLEFQKSIKLKKGAHQLVVTNKITNNGAENIFVRNYETISRSGNFATNIMLPTFTGAAFYDEENKFLKIGFDEILEDESTYNTDSSWISMIEHYFFTAWLPSGETKKTIYTSHDESIYTIGSTTDYESLGPGQSLVFSSVMFVGPKLQAEISPLAQGLDLTVDYGVLTFLAAPLFWIMDSINFLVDNWGVSIILLTFLIKALFFKLSETSYRSMAQMKKLNPRMQALKERYADDKKKFSEALMRMYKEEKVNPLGGCLPILIQIPVFIALYWVLVESIEIRHAPFFGWIQDLSSADPLFILPIAMGISMYIQQKLNPAPTDATQQKIFLFLPFIFTALFATFPAGLVLYWLTNNILSIAQQYVINKRIVG